MNELEFPREWTDIGHGHELSLARDERGHLIGVWVRHECEKCPWHGKESATSVGAGAFIPLTAEVSTGMPWTLVRENPLTIRPSIHDLSCGDHGWIKDGKWVPA